MRACVRACAVCAIDMPRPAIQVEVQEGAVYPERLALAVVALLGEEQQRTPERCQVVHLGHRSGFKGADQASRSSCSTAHSLGPKQYRISVSITSRELPGCDVGSCVYLGCAARP